MSMLGCYFCKEELQWSEVSIVSEKAGPIFSAFHDNSWDFAFCVLCNVILTYELRHEKTCFLYMRKQRRRSAAQ